jgi:hydrogenase maturation protease
VRRKSKIAIVGIGNTLAGDDGVGVLIAERLQQRWNTTREVLVAILPGDLFSVSGFIGEAEEFLFVDAIAGDRAGEIRILGSAQRAFAASLHQTDIGSVMGALKNLEMADPFPLWQVWGITIETPEELGEGLSPEIAAAADELERRVVEYVEALLAE